MTEYQFSGNFGDQFLNGRRLTSNVKKTDFTYEYAANPVLPMNVGFEQSSVGQFNPALSLSAYLTTGTSTTTLHDYLAYTYNAIGLAGDVEIVYTDWLGLDATPVIGNPSCAGVFTLSTYEVPRDTTSVFMANPQFVARGVHSSMGDLIDYFVASSAFSSSPITSTPYYDRGVDYAVADVSGGFAAFQWASADGTGTVQVEVQTCATTGGTYVTCGTMIATLNAFLGWGYVVIPSVANSGVALNRYTKVKYTLSSSPQTVVTGGVHFGAFNP